MKLILVFVFEVKIKISKGSSPLQMFLHDLILTVIITSTFLRDQNLCSVLGKQEIPKPQEQKRYMAQLNLNGSYITVLIWLQKGVVSAKKSNLQGNNIQICNLCILSKKYALENTPASLLCTQEIDYDKILKSRHPTDLAPQADLCRFLKYNVIK